MPLPAKTPTAKADAVPAINLPGVHDEGVYFGLAEDEYHADPSLGSSSLKLLAKNPSSFWWGSWMNPRKPSDKDTPARLKGRAVHQLVLYGEDEFDRNFMRGATHTDDMTPAEKGAATKAANAQAAASGRAALNADVYDNIAIASAMISKNPQLATALRGGINEVSVFWHEEIDGMVVPLKARFDCLKPRGVGDLKSLANKFEKPFERACIDAIVNYDYVLQAEHYLNARGLVPKFAKQGFVFGDHDAELFAKIVASTTYAWQWIFWSSEGAPVTASRVLSPGNPLFEVAGAQIKRAKTNFVEYMKKFGTQEMWLLQEEPTELYMEDMPPWFGR